MGMFAQEIRLVPRIAKTRADVNVAWCYPNTYSIGMSGLGYQLIWWLMEQDEEVMVHRAFTDIAEEGVGNCDLLGFTLSWELDFTNVLSMLKSNRIPLEGSHRGEEHPIVFAGGPVLSANPEPFAEIFDVILLGDAEETVPRLLKCWKEIRSLPRQEKLLRLAQEAGIYVPSLYESKYDSESGAFVSTIPKHDGVPEIVSKSLFRAPDGYVAHSVLLSPDTTWGDVFLVEVVRSCPQECRFCLASFLTRPFRAAAVDTIIEKIDLARPHTKRVGLLGPSITEHPEFDAIASRLIERPDLKVTVASVRADTLTKQLVEKFCTLGQKSVTIALESGSERLRRIMKKNLTEPEIFQAVEAIDAGGLDGVKFYGIAGLPYETQGDLEETVRLLRQLKKAHRRLKFVFGLSSFVPKAQTPFQWKGRDRDTQSKMEFLRKNLAGAGIDVRTESHNWSDIQALLSRGDRRLTEVLLAVAESKGKLGDWKRALKSATGVPPLEYYAYRDIDPSEVLPWSHVAPEEKLKYLGRHLEEAAREALLTEG